MIICRREGAGAGAAFETDAPSPTPLHSACVARDGGGRALLTLADDDVGMKNGPQQVCLISQDDKTQVRLGISAPNKQAPILMQVEYRVTLPDHDWVIAERHKLIPSVYAGIIIQPNGEGRPDAVSYSGPTYVAIRSGEHCSASLKSHASDLKRLLDLTDFQISTKTPQGHVKPVFIITVDGGPDENPRYPFIANAINHFIELNLDILFIVTNAPERSTYNKVERRMAPLSHELAGLVLPYDYFGTHLNDQNEMMISSWKRKISNKREKF
ncbi:hypothetical protein EVAR_98464_1 [Eumeta japonica]|uniref:Uncharacterized protein n=1 Tax=Eumeta variegata TaxID=151549 RepID=A0A4C1YMU9_EUMVA|nr:hypothetical protein EVAR_98464_1 [Eumeta japonica]